ncbi:hypothetical protein [Geomobilimonas luticola]|uniref:Uncharacterized protein n=1 Tax=Geomobilimonas luticola TaxID=1114878 RepID=A0ABS5SFL9_9BACT|nr:hypothetical protein [Geomobilimonas luticola]MBT0654148.1 hypothetical protein [Geomobilimonas luticola]
MKKEFPFIEIPERFKEIIGTPDPGTRMYKAIGDRSAFRLWNDAVFEICAEEGAVSPGGASLYTYATRAGVHKRLKEGRLTGFFFSIVTDSKWIKGRKTLEEGGRPYGFIPYSECKAWAKELEEREKVEGVETVKKEAQGTKADLDDDFLLPSKDWRKKYQKKGGE